MTQFAHIPVLLQLVIRELAIKSGQKYIDATIGGGGHTLEILKHGGKVLGIDQDLDALNHVKEKLSSYISTSQLVLSYGNFKDIREIAQKNGFTQVSGILFDLGVSSYQLDTSKRGFSIRFDERLDMRMDQGLEISAYEIVNKYPESDLAELFVTYGEEEKGYEVAHEIAQSRKTKKIETTGELITIIQKIVKRQGKLHPATKVFQALRIEVNQELDALKKGLSESIELVENEGKIAVISFHSLEDRMVKKLFDSWEETSIGVVITQKPLTANTQEATQNPRARSAKLRVFEKRITHV